MKIDIEKLLIFKNSQSAKVGNSAKILKKLKNITNTKKYY